ncbi:hypothetical protein [Phenylobacterium sp.]|uniref:hypothetical protein n=1 Tax=Phenylobacterium sp. TaxID=1871053 RepID=UPI0035AFB63F
MAKTKRKTKSLLPKRIAGVKVPKAVRKGRFGELLASRTGQVLIAEAIMAAGAMAGARKAGQSPSARSFLHDAAEHIRDRGRGHVELGPAGGALAFALGEAARAFADALRSGAPQADTTRHDAEADWQPAPDGGLDGAQKKSPPKYEAGPL